MIVIKFAQPLLIGLESLRVKSVIIGKETEPAIAFAQNCFFEFRFGEAMIPQKIDLPNIRDLSLVNLKIDIRTIFLKLDNFWFHRHGKSTHSFVHF